MNWCFAMINGRLAEVFFERKGEEIKFLGHAHVKASEYKTQAEKKTIKDDTTKVRLSYRNGKYLKVKKSNSSFGILIS